MFPAPCVCLVACTGGARVPALVTQLVLASDRRSPPRPAVRQGQRLRQGDRVRYVMSVGGTRVWCAVGFEWWMCMGRVCAAAQLVIAGTHLCSRRCSAAAAIGFTVPSRSAAARPVPSAAAPPRPTTLAAAPPPPPATPAAVAAKCFGPSRGRREHVGKLSDCMHMLLCAVAGSGMGWGLLRWRHTKRACRIRRKSCAAPL